MTVTKNYNLGFINIDFKMLEVTVILINRTYLYFTANEKPDIAQTRETLRHFKIKVVLFFSKTALVREEKSYVYIISKVYFNLIKIRCLIRSHTRYTNVCVASMRANQTSNFN